MASSGEGSDMGGGGYDHRTTDASKSRNDSGHIARSRSIDFSITRGSASKKSNGLARRFVRAAKIRWRSAGAALAEPASTARMTVATT